MKKLFTNFHNLSNYFYYRSRVVSETHWWFRGKAEGIEENSGLDKKRPMYESHFWLRCNSFVSLPRSRVCFTAWKLVEGKPEKTKEHGQKKEIEGEREARAPLKTSSLSVHRCPASSNSLFNLQSCLPFVLEVHPLLRRRTGSLFPLPFSFLFSLPRWPFDSVRAHGLAQWRGSKFRRSSRGWNWTKFAAGKGTKRGVDK